MRSMAAQQGAQTIEIASVVNDDAAIASSGWPLRVQPKLAALYLIAEDFVIYAAIIGV